jgi:hypothetical protein
MALKKWDEWRKEQKKEVDFLKEVEESIGLDADESWLEKNPEAKESVMKGLEQAKRGEFADPPDLTRAEKICQIPHDETYDEEGGQASWADPTDVMIGKCKSCDEGIYEDTDEADLFPVVGKCEACMTEADWKLFRAKEDLQEVEEELVPNPEILAPWEEEPEPKPEGPRNFLAGAPVTVNFQSTPILQDDIVVTDVIDDISDLEGLDLDIELPECEVPPQETIDLTPAPAIPPCVDARTINLTKKQWRQVKGIGNTVAERLVEGGPFVNFEESGKIKGVSKTLLERIKEFVSLLP